MVTKDIINKTFEDLLLKHGSFHRNLVLQLKGITDTEEEYNELKDAIWDWQTRFHNAQEEHLKVKNILGEEAEMTGEEDCCWKTDEMYKIMNNARLLYTIHNHPNTACLFSESDILCLEDGKEKYSMVLGEDGVMIIKNPYESFSKEEKEHLEEVGSANDKMLHDYIRKKHKSKFEKWEVKILDESLSHEEIIKTARKLTDFVNKEMGVVAKQNDKQFAEELNQIFKNNNLNCSVHFIPKKKNTEKNGVNNSGYKI